VSIKINKLRLTGFFLIITAFLSIITVYAQQGIGTSEIIINSTTVSVNQGFSTNVTYTVKLVSGNTWGTDISVINQSTLASQGVTVQFSNNGQDPNFSGIATINTSSTTKPGDYVIQFIATGDDPSTSPTAITLTVNGKQNTTTTKTNQTSTTQNTTKSINSTTVNTAPYITNNQNSSSFKVQPNNYSNTSNQYPLYISIIAVIILFAVIIIRLRSL
jgi:hypothetical protein